MDERQQKQVNEAAEKFAAMPYAASSGISRRLSGMRCRATTSRIRSRPTAAPVQRSWVSRGADMPASRITFETVPLNANRSGGDDEVDVAAARMTHPVRPRRGDGQRSLDHPRTLVGRGL